MGHYSEQGAQIETFLLQYNGNHIWMVVRNGHVEWSLQSHTKSVIRQSLLGLEVGVSPLL